MLRSPEQIRCARGSQPSGRGYDEEGGIVFVAAEAAGGALGKFFEKDDLLAVFGVYENAAQFRFGDFAPAFGDEFVFGPARFLPAAAGVALIVIVAGKEDVAGLSNLEIADAIHSSSGHVHDHLVLLKCFRDTDPAWLVGRHGERNGRHIEDFHGGRIAYNVAPGNWPGRRLRSSLGRGALVCAREIDIGGGAPGRGDKNGQNDRGQPRRGRLRVSDAKLTLRHFHNVFLH